MNGDIKKEIKMNRNAIKCYESTIFNVLVLLCFSLLDFNALIRKFIKQSFSISCCFNSK